jgi:hypothetical protein
VDDGYTCNPKISRFWGQYSPWFSVPSDIDEDIPKGCSVTFASVLSRHGGRDPTASKTKSYNATVQKIHKNTISYSKEYSFIKEFEYTLGADQLTTLGRQEMVNSGEKFGKRYKSFSKKDTPFARASDQTRVVESGNAWLQGYYYATTGQNTTKTVDVTISEEDGKNNTLNHNLCTAFEESEVGDNAQEIFANIFLPPIQKRLNENLVGANLTQTEALYVMDLCPFTTMADPRGQIQPFCGLFTVKEWHQYDYYQSLGKWYGYGKGNALGPTNGVGYVNELIARLTQKPVLDHTSVNHTLDDNPATFPLNRTIYADFSHDNDMTAILAALGLYDRTRQLSNTTVMGTDATKGYSAAWTVSFGARVYFEKMTCQGSYDEQVRIIVNDRVMPMPNCGSDGKGRCTLGKFVDSLDFARKGGLWDQCFV